MRARSPRRAVRRAGELFAPRQGRARGRPLPPAPALARAVVFHSLDFIARLAALVPRPKPHMVTHHGCSRRPPNSATGSCPHSRAPSAEIRQVFEIDVLSCPFCGGKRKLIALITDVKVPSRVGDV